MYKSLEDVLNVIELRKPMAVVDMFLESYLQGVEYSKWCGGVDITEEQLVNVYEPVDVSSSMAQWKIDNYAILRQAEYPPMTEFLDAQVKGDDVALQAYKDKCIAVKAKYPK